LNILLTALFTVHSFITQFPSTQEYNLLGHLEQLVS